MPACLLSTAPLDEKNARKADEEEMAAAAWLLCGPQAKEARERLVSGLDKQKALGFAACCAAVLGRRPQLDLGTRNLSAEFEMCLLARSWHEMPYLLNEALLSVESWAICAAALARLARDAAVCAGRCGSQLPLLAGDSVALLPEGPQLLQKEAVELTQNVLKGDITPALQAWLTICRPIALWVWAGAAKGFCAPVGSSFAEEKLDVGSQVVKAVRAAVACFLSEAAILEVWDLLKDPNLGRMLLPRPGGGWMWLDPDTDWPSDVAARAGCDHRAARGSFLALVAGQDSHVSVLVDQLNYGVLKPSDLERLSPALAQAFAHALGITPEDIQDAAGHLSEVDLHPGTTRNQYMPDTWPLAQPGTGTVVSARARLPSTNLAFIAEDTLGGGLFESKLRKVVGDVLGHDSEAILGQLAVDAAVVHEDVAGRDDPAATQAQPRDKALGAKDTDRETRPKACEPSGSLVAQSVSGSQAAVVRRASA
ncbi:unnamed protein product [Effrenium voratum]|nr:unnamed protein product [Effrenium voratum]